MRFSSVILVLFCATSVATGNDEPIDFARQILPILSDKCFVCHGPDAKENTGLRLDSFETATADRGGYQAINPTRPEESALLTRIGDPDEPMPPADAEKHLTDREKNLLSQWILQGGHYAKHWAFVVPEKTLSAGGDPHTDPIDRFILDRLRAEGTTLAPQADRQILARRAALVLTGLPPEPAQLSRLLRDSSPNAWLRFVGSLLSSPRFGEHQARYWLDAVRYGDTHGLHLDNRRGIWPYRDWVVRALNANQPLDRFITWQLAGDLLPDPTMEQLVATGYVRMNPTTSEGGVLPEEFQARNNFDRTENLGTVFLGMSLTCARCHTHKYDPVPQREYYRLLAFFNSTAEPPLDKNAYEFGPTLKVPPDQKAWEQYAELMEARDELIHSVESQLPDLQLSGDPIATCRDGSLGERFALLAAIDGPFATTAAGSAARKLTTAIAVAEEAFTTTLIARDLDIPRTTRVLRRGEYNLPTGEPLEPGVLSVMGDLSEGAPRNRLGLARWLTSRKHPVVARVLVNRIWQRTFGHALVRTPEDFGLQGQQPTHPELLDWLAADLQDSGWDLKHMLRLMVTSRTFRQSSAIRPHVDDPDNRLFARGPRFRLDAEVIRDIGLWASGLLDPHMGGEGVKPYQPAGLWKALAHPASNTKEYVRDEGRQLYRRSLYVYWKRTSPHPMMTLFDAPDRESSCVRRGRTNTSLQSLGLLNETQRIETGRSLAARLIHYSQTDAGRLKRLFTLLACRTPDEAEAAACQDLVTAMRQRYGAAPDDAAALLAIGDAPPDSAISPAELAAWTQLSVTILASDIALLLY